MQSRKRWLLRGLAGALASSGCMAAAGAAAPLSVPDIALGVAGDIQAIARQPDGGIILGGQFTSIDGVPRRNLARLRPDGTLDMQWHPSADGGIAVMAVDAVGDIYVGGGYLKSIDGQPRRYLAKLSSDGRVNVEWNGGANVSDVTALALNAQGDVFVAGSIQLNPSDFTTYRYIGKFSGSGSGAIDSNWNPPLEGNVRTMIADGNGAIYVAASGHDEGCCLYKLRDSGNGAELAGSRPALGGMPSSLAMGTDGALYAGGGFALPSGETRYLLRFAPDGKGEIDSSWQPPYKQIPTALAVDASGALYANLGTSLVKSVRTADGSAATQWEVPSGAGHALAVADDSVYVGGNFDLTWEAPPDRLTLARVSTADGTPRQTVDALGPGMVNAIAFQANGGVIVGGDFRRVGTVTRNRLLRLKPDGSLDPDWNPAVALAGVNAVAVDAHDNVYVGGYTVSADAPIAKLSGTGTGAPAPGWKVAIASYGEVHALAVDGQDGLYVGGSYKTIGGNDRSNIAKISQHDAALIDTWNAQSQYTVWAIVVDADAVYVGSGDMVSDDFGIVFTPHGAVAKLSNSTGSDTGGWNYPVAGLVHALAPAAEGSLYAGGYFESDASNARYVLKLGRDGVPDSRWNAEAENQQPQRHVTSLALDAAGDVYAGWAYYSSLEDRNGAALLSKLSAATGSTLPNASPVIDGSEIDVAVATQDGRLYLGGNFTRVGEQPRGGLAALTLPLQSESPGRWRWQRPMPPILQGRGERLIRPPVHTGQAIER